MVSNPPITTKATPLDWTFRVLGFLAMTAIALSLPGVPSAELDASWRMALGKFLVEGRQFGTEVVFTYGPLGFVMGKTYWGGQWASLIGWHVAQAVVFTTVIYWQGYRLSGYNRIFFFLFFFLFGLTYQDAMHMTIMAMAGLELIRRSNAPWQWSSVALVALLAVLSLVKFTNMLLGLTLVLLAGALEIWTRRRPSALRVPALFLGLFLLGWKLCGQHLANIPAYLHSSWEISQGYQDAMGYPCPTYQLYLGLTVAGLMLSYLALNLLVHSDRIRCAAFTLGVGAYLYLNWKHGFIRADGHQVGFYYAVFTVIVTAPIFLEDSARFRLPRQLMLGAAGLITLVSIELVLPGLTRGILATAQNKVDGSIHFALGLSNNRATYDVRLEGEKHSLDLHKTRTTVGRSTVDVLGFEQGVAIFNDFNYTPRPVFQGYSAYTPYLSRLNYEFYASDRAPEYVLFKLQSIDGRLHTMDDPHVLRLLVQRYTYLFSEQGFTLWKRKPGAFNAAQYEPKLIRSVAAHMGQKISLADLTSQSIWVQIDYQFSLLGKLRRFFFKPPLVQLRITDENGQDTLHRLPRPIGETGFMLNPVIDDLPGFMRAAGGVPKRHAQAITIEVNPQDDDCLQSDVAVSFFSMPVSDAGVSYFKDANRSLFHMFVDAPVTYTALNPPNEDMIDGRRVMIMHAPSEMVFEVPPGATVLTGAFGFVPGAYTNGGQSNGADFSIIWTNGSDPVVLFERSLDPATKLNDRGLQNFTVSLPKGSGQVFLRVGPGNFNQYAYDWTGWTGIEFK